MALFALQFNVEGVGIPGVPAQLPSVEVEGQMQTEAEFPDRPRTPQMSRCLAPGSKQGPASEDAALDGV